MTRDVLNETVERLTSPVHPPESFLSPPLDAPRSLEISSCGENLSFDFCHIHDGAYVTIHIDRQQTTDTMLLNLASLSPSEELWFHNRGDNHLSIKLVEYLRGSKHLRHLKLEGDEQNISPFVEALGAEIEVQQYRSDGNGFGRSCGFEALHTLEFKEDRFTSVYGIAVFPLGDLLIKNLKRRKEVMGVVGIERIRINEQFPLGKEELMEIRAYVPDTEIVPSEKGSAL